MSMGNGTFHQDEGPVFCILYSVLLILELILTLSAFGAPLPWG